MLEHAEQTSPHAYVALSLLVGIRTEEARALRWSHVVTWSEARNQWQTVTEAGFRHEKFAVYVWRSVRADGETKTAKSRRTLEIPDQAARALHMHHGSRGPRRWPAMKLRRLRDGDVLEDGGMVLVRGGDLDPDILLADAARWRMQLAVAASMASTGSRSSLSAAPPSTSSLSRRRWSASIA